MRWCYYCGARDTTQTCMGRGCCHSCGYVSAVDLPPARPPALEWFLPPLSTMGLNLNKKVPTIISQFGSPPHIAHYAYGYGQNDIELYDVVAWTGSSSIKFRQVGRDVSWNSMPLDLWVVGDISMGRIQWRRLARVHAQQGTPTNSIWYAPVLGLSEPPSLPDEFTPATWDATSELTSVTLFARLMDEEWNWLESCSLGGSPAPIPPLGEVAATKLTPVMSDDPYGLKSVNRKRDALLASIFN